MSDDEPIVRGPEPAPPPRQRITWRHPAKPGLRFPADLPQRMVGLRITGGLIELGGETLAVFDNGVVVAAWLVDDGAAMMLTVEA